MAYTNKSGKAYWEKLVNITNLWVISKAFISSTVHKDKITIYVNFS